MHDENADPRRGVGLQGSLKGVGEPTQVDMKDLLQGSWEVPKILLGMPRQPTVGNLGNLLGPRPQLWEISLHIPTSTLALTFHVTFACCPLSSPSLFPLPLPPFPLALLSADYQERFNPNALKDSALSTHKPIEVKGLGGKATIIHAQYNTPISMYSQDAIMDAIAGQAQAQGSDFSG